MDAKARIEAVHRVQAHIERHIHEPITLQQLAKAAEVSPWHTSRMFTEVTGKTPFEYIRSYRLSQAAIRLLDGRDRVIDVAFDFLFDTHEGFTKAFSRRFGMTPSRFRRLRPEARLFLPPRTRELDLSRVKGAQYMPSKQKNRGTGAAAPKTVFIQVVDRPERKLLLKRGVQATDYFAYCREVGCDVWDVLGSIEGAIHEPMGMWLPENLRSPDTSEYVQAVEVPAGYTGPVPGGFELLSVPPCKLMVFQGQPFDDEDFEDAIGELQDAIKRHDPETNGYRWAESDAPRFQLIPLGYRGYIEGRPVRPLGD